MKCPCQNCESRKTGCHAKCDLYSNWKKEQKEEKKSFKSEISTAFLIDQVRKQKRRFGKK
jgi:hypothetical protein